ncbi:hypothetical protein SNEBB_006355 [Seison nebaliae]|nr:hypothetical protein SNEBB_006355 [Seison nebaliae]
MKIVSDSNLLGEIWKEYAKSDGRYVIGEEGTVAIEMLTAFIVGPICLLTYIAIIINNKYRHILQILSSTCQLYGVLIFFLSEYLFGWIHTRYLDAYYFYFYFFFFNVVWVFVPFYIIVRSSLIIIRQQHDVDLLRIKKKMK